MATAKKTAAAKPAATKTPLSSSRALMPWEQEMANRAKKVKQQEVPLSFGKRISIQGGIMKIDDEAVEGNELEVIILASLHENQFYTSNYTPGVPTVPACYAFSGPDDEDPDETMRAHKEADAPQGGDDFEPEGGEPERLCSDCWANVMGTADVGRGKACKNIRRLMVLPADALEDPSGIADAEMRQLSVPVMSTKFWSKYANMIADDMSRDFSGVVTKVKVVPDAKAQFLVQFEFVELINYTQELWDALEKKRSEAYKDLAAPYPHQADLDAAAKPVKPQGRMAQAMAKGKAGAKTAPAKKATRKF